MTKLLALSLFAGALFLGACSSSFESRWKEAGSYPAPGEFAGRWDGQWISAKHRNAGGRLRCILTPRSENQYHASFKANWLLFTSSYETVFESRRRGDRLIFAGQQNLGTLYGGIYTFKGTATPRRFLAEYDSSYDTGRFEMARVPASKRR